MKTKIGIILFFWISSGSAQNWQWSGTGTNEKAEDIIEYKDSSLIAAGKFFKFNSLNSGGSFPLIVKGKKNSSGIWQWSSIGSTDGSIHDIISYNGDLYIGGQFGLINQMQQASGIAKYTTFWSAFANAGVMCSINAASSCGVYALCEYNGELYAAGTFTSMSGIPVENIARWNGTSWSAVGGGITTASINDGVRKLIVFNNDLYAMGYFTGAGNVSAQNMARWDGSSWSSVTTFPANSQILSAEVFDGALYVGGNFTTVGSVPVNGVARYDGISWSDAGQGLQNSGGVTCMAALNDTLYAGGIFNFPSSSSVNSHVARWNGSSWEFFGAFGISFSSGSVSMLRAAYGDLYVSGLFTSIDNKPVSNIAKITTSKPVVAGMQENVLQGFSVFPNPMHTEARLTITKPGPEVSAGIYNLLGEEVRKLERLDDRFEIKRNDLSSGVYIIRVTSAAGTQIERLIIGDE